MRVSDDNGEIFGPMMRLFANGTIDDVKEQKKENRLYFSLSFSQSKLHKKFLLVSEYDKFTEIAAYKTRLWMNIYLKITLIMIKYSPEGTQKLTLDLLQNRGILPVNMFCLIPYLLSLF